MVTVLGVLGILYHSKNTNERKKNNELVANQEHPVIILRPFSLSLWIVCLCRKKKKKIRMT